MPNCSADRTEWATFDAAINNFDGMHPTVAHVVPLKCGSIRSVVAPFERAARSAARPAVPAPIIATLQRSVSVTSVRNRDRFDVHEFLETHFAMLATVA